MADENTLLFPYSARKRRQQSRVVVTALLFLAALLFLWRSHSSSLFEPQNAKLSDAQNTFANTVTATAFAVLGFFGVFRIWNNKPNEQQSVTVGASSVSAPHQGIPEINVTMLFADVVRLHKRSVDGVWEFNIVGNRQNIRIPKAALANPDDFEKMIVSIAARVQQCAVDVEERIDPPFLSS